MLDRITNQIVNLISLIILFSSSYSYGGLTAAKRFLSISPPPPAVSYSNSASFTTAGATTFTVPAGVTSIKVSALGGGGGGSWGEANNGGGGGSGGYSASTLSVTPGTTFNIVVGAGGNGGSLGGGGGKFQDSCRV